MRQNPGLAFDLQFSKLKSWATPGLSLSPPIFFTPAFFVPIFFIIPPTLLLF
jgi:hypothetical protein